MNTSVTPRSPLRAALMSAVLPGLGQVYLARPQAAIGLFLAILASGVVGVGAAAHLLSGTWMILGLLASLLAMVVTWLSAIVDAWLDARSRTEFAERPWQGIGTYVLVTLICSGFVLPASAQWVRRHVVEAFVLPSGSMAPTLLAGDRVFADKRYNCPGCRAGVSRGDVVIYIYPNDRTRYYVKRIVGLPGDRIEITERVLRVNGVAVTEAAAAGVARERIGDRHWNVQWDDAAVGAPPVDLVVPQGQVYVLGDQRSVSQDSRQFGPVPLVDVVGRVRQIWWSRADGAIRWSRLGMTL